MRSRVMLLALFVAFCSVVGKANQLPPGDPVIRTGGIDPPGSASIITSSFTIESPSGTSPGTSPCKLFQFGVLTSTSPTCLFENDINPNGVGLTIASLTFDAPLIPFGLQDKCDVTSLPNSPFANCRVDALTGGGTQFTFFDGSIPFKTDFFLDFEGFPANTSFEATATVPEPGTLELVLIAGLAAAFARIRVRGKA
jgi:hypothetical protein